MVNGKLTSHCQWVKDLSSFTENSVHGHMYYHLTVIFCTHSNLMFNDLYICYFCFCVPLVGHIVADSIQYQEEAEEVEK